ncbi:MAG: sulfatase-like hydrolase/transferase [Opitutaceae bacterium]|nr:sulfatase-like hydrolase/transferase [Opitutaceae bacterium]
MSVGPDILWIITTQWRAQACGHAGDPNASTPNLDALAAEGTRYAQAVTPHPFGPFARAAVLTGVPCPANGVRDYFDPLPSGSRTIAHALQERGYDTAFFGKWHLAARDPAAPLVGETHARMMVPPDARGGFETWQGFEGGFLLNHPWLHGTGLPQPVQMRGYQPVVLAEVAERWLLARGNDPRPWFCVVSMETPHPPYEADADGLPRRDPARLVLAPNVPRGGEVEARARRELAGYYTHIEATDRAVGRLLSKLRHDQSPIVVLTSVHGDMHGAHGFFRKGWPHEESIRVPLLVRTPDEPGGATEQAAISLLNLPAMTIAWAEGRRPTMRAEACSISMPSVVALPHQCDRVWHGVRTARRKLVLNDDGSPWLFFDLEEDPSETRNLVNEPGRSAEMRALRELAG